MARKKRKPGYWHHKASGQAYVRIDGTDHYLGPYDSPESRERYDELIREWTLQRGNVDALTLTLDELALRYLEFARGYYRKNGELTNEAQSIHAVLRLLIQFAGPERVCDFSPRRFRQFRDWMVKQPDRRFSQEDRTLSRQYVNKSLQKVVRAFKWGVAEGIVSAECWQALKAVDGLRKGRTAAREAPSVKPVADVDIEAVLPFLSPVVVAMVKLQRLTGMRPGEVVELRPQDVTRRIDGLWCYRPASFKTEHHEDAERIIFLEPKAQMLLKPWLNRDADTHCFSPRESVAWQQEQKRAKRQSKVQPSQEDRSRKKPKKLPGTKYSSGTYRQSIHYGCDKAKVARWSPNQIRHAVATSVRAEYGLEGSQLVLGHSRADVTQVYAERDQQKAIEIAKAIG